MKVYELNAEQVKNELETLIQKYPTRRGSVPVDDYEDDFTCVYYTDENDYPINSSSYDSDDVYNPTLKTPVCIVGTWIEEFHPEFKDDEVIRDILVRNATIGTLREDHNPFPEDVTRILSEAQSAQDARNSEWKDIVL